MPRCLTAGRADFLSARSGEFHQYLRSVDPDVLFRYNPPYPRQEDKDILPQAIGRSKLSTDYTLFPALIASEV